MTDPRPGFGLRNVLMWILLGVAFAGTGSIGFIVWVVVTLKGGEGSLP